MSAFGITPFVSQSTFKVSAEESNLKAETLWAAVPSGSKEKILQAVWCGSCRTGVKIVDYTVSEERGDVILKGRCAVCGGRVGRLVETSDMTRPKR